MKFLELKKLNMDTSFNSEEKSDNAASIETLLRNENILANDDDDDGEKTVSIKELDVIGDYGINRIRRSLMKTVLIRMMRI